METTKPPVAEPARLLDVVAVAAMLNVSTRHTYRLADSGRMPRPLKLGGACRWDRQVISAWISAGCPSVDSRQGARR
ncbi:MAG: helix-turn-helix domain-containing protein [Pirellulaceae bacterium]|nr:helix-turn-helix domain-containing protein [Pirellulaceae bacterium]